MDASLSLSANANPKNGKLRTAVRALLPLAALLVALPALWPLLRPGFFVSDDGLFHVYRIAALADAWRHGVLYPRLFPAFGFGYGQAVLNFYAPLTYWPGALMALLGLNPATAAELTIALGFLLAALAAYAFANDLWGPMGGLLAALAYTYFPYHLADAYVRGAIPEHFAFIWPPLILWAHTRAFRDEKPLPALLWGALAWAGLVYTHNLTAVMMVPAAVLYLLLLALSTGRWRRLPAVAGSLALAVALSAPLWLPFLAENSSVGIALGPSDGYRKHLAPLALAIQSTPIYGYRLTQGGAADHPLSWLTAVVFLAALALAGWRLASKRSISGGLALGFGALLAALAAFMITAPSLPVWRAFQPVLAQLQYPWRFLALAAVGTMMMAGALPALLPRGWQYPAAALLGLALLVTALAGLAVKPLDLPAADVWAPDRMWREDAAAGQVGATWTGEFLPLTVKEQRWALGRAREGAVDGLAPATRPAVTLAQLGYAGAALDVDSTAPQAIRLHQFYLPGWVASLDGRPAAVYASGEMGLVTVDVPAGSHHLAISFGPTPARDAGAALAAVAALIWVGLAQRARPSTKPRPTTNITRMHEYGAVPQDSCIRGPIRGRLCHSILVRQPHFRRTDISSFATPSPKRPGLTAGSRVAPTFRSGAYGNTRNAVAKLGQGFLPLRVAALVVLLLLLALGLNRFGIGQQTWTPRPANAAFEDVALLLGGDAQPVPGESALDVTLYWFALRDLGTDYKAFVHLVSQGGQVVAQHDLDPGGGFTPTTRWRAGEIVPDRHRLALPAGFTAGSYTLKAGLYQLQPSSSGTSQPRNLSIDPPTADNRADLGALGLTAKGGLP